MNKLNVKTNCVNLVGSNRKFNKDNLLVDYAISLAKKSNRKIEIQTEEKLDMLKIKIQDKHS